MQLVLIATDKDVIEFCRKEGFVYLRSLSLYEFPENIEELKVYYKNNDRIEITDRSVKDRCYIWVSDQLGDLKLCFVITEKEINCVTLGTQIESIAEMCLIIDKILGDK
jgi:hypothetical protein